MPRTIILGIVILFAFFFGYAGYRLSGGGHNTAIWAGGIGAVVGLLLMRLTGVF
jgi:hypothetical protein